jgi:DNA-binding NtrC family response regulator
LCDYEWPGNVRELRNVVERLVVRVRGRAISRADLPTEVLVGRPPAPAQVSGPSRGEQLFSQLVSTGESFWSVVYDPFMHRDLTREDLRALVARGLEETHGNYVMLVDLFNLERRDYKRLLNFLHKHGCHLPVSRFRARSVRPRRESSPPPTPADPLAMPR